jgi:hypothetical protein
MAESEARSTKMTKSNATNDPENVCFNKRSAFNDAFFTARLSGLAPQSLTLAATTPIRHSDNRCEPPRNKTTAPTSATRRSALP